MTRLHRASLGWDKNRGRIARVDIDTRSSPAITRRRFARWLPPRPLTAETFAPFGQVIECAGYAIDEGGSQRFTDLAQLETDAEGRLALSIFRADARQPPTNCTAWNATRSARKPSSRSTARPS